MHHQTLFVIWTLAGVVLYTICLVGTIKAPTTNGAWWFMMPSPIVTIYGCMPVIVSIVTKNGIDIVTHILPAALAASFIAMIPCWVYMRRQQADSRAIAVAEAAAREQRAVDAEALIRRLGA